MHVSGRTGAVRDVGIAAGIDHQLGQDSLASGLALDDHPADRVSLHDRRNEHAVQHRDHTGFGDQTISNVFERLGIECVADRLRFGQGRTHRLGAVFELAPDPFAVGGGRVAIPRKALYPDLGDIAAEAAVAFDQRGLDPGPCRSQRRRQSARARAHHQHIGFMNHRDVARRLGYDAAHRCVVSQSGAT